MYGYVSNNLKTTINKYFDQKLINISFKHVEPIEEFENIITKIKVETLIIDSSCFYDDQVAIDFCYKLKITKPDIRLIVICFNNQLITDIAMLGIYDIINYQKKLDLIAELDQIILTPKNLSDLKQYLNTNIIKNKNSTCKLIGGLGFESNSYLSTFLLNFTAIYHPGKVCYVETNNIKHSLINYFNALDLATTTKIKDEKYKYNDCDILFYNNEKWKKDHLLSLILNLKTKYDVVIFDMGAFPLCKQTNDLLDNIDELIIMKSDNIFNNYEAYNSVISKMSIPITEIDYKELYDKNIYGLNSQLITNYINNNFKEYKLESENTNKVKDDIKSVIYKIKDHLNKRKEEEI